MVQDITYISAPTCVNKISYFIFSELSIMLKLRECIACHGITTIPCSNPVVEWHFLIIIRSWISLVYNINIFVHFYGFNTTESKTICTCDHANNNQSIQKVILMLPKRFLVFKFYVCECFSDLTAVKNIRELWDELTFELQTFGTWITVYGIWYTGIHPIFQSFPI